MPTYDELLARLREWAATHDAPTRAAVDLLATQGSWFRNRRFTDACIAYDGGQPFIQWWRAHELIEQDQLIASSGELAVLQLAVFLVRDPLGLSSLDTTNKNLAARAFATALGIER